MKYLLLIPVLLYLYFPVYGQQGLKKTFPHSVFCTQFAGSTGFLSAGYLRATQKNKIETGLMYGFTPAKAGGPLHTAALKFIYNPFSLPVASSFSWEPLQAGAFVAASFGENLGFAWEKKYPRGYYWWNRNVRYHVFAGTQVSLNVNKKRLKKVSFYFEVNTNDLYLLSYIPSRQSTKLYDILFFGTGIKAFFN